MQSVLTQEIKWHRKHKGTSGKGPVFELGFLAGLRHAKFLANSMVKTKPRVIRVKK